MAIDADCCDKRNNINFLEKNKFCEDANGNICVNTCETKPEGNGLKRQFECDTYTQQNVDDKDELCFLTCTVAAGKKLFVDQIVVAFHDFGEFLLKVEGNTEMRLVTSPAQTTIPLRLTPSIPIAAGETVEICFSGPCTGNYSATLLGTQFSI